MADELGVAEESGRAMVVGVEEGYLGSAHAIDSLFTWSSSLLNGFFFKNRKHVSSNSRNLVR